ncbi:hypothetical protein PoB_001466100 [Plakobranchus ocellatus]|uniref:Uncharacterized protein n=1 Tax=Plakobranchus ocellatus TaxID=259542 RepID=A0AAV3YXC6_9GAST|nr:hypothetical protein PoB_001466100 [Plakobranchus ocellatus]
MPAARAPGCRVSSVHKPSCVTRVPHSWSKRVAITIYWLGQQAASQPHVYQGPQLDLTAFSALVNRKHHDLVHRSDWEAAGAAVTSQQRHNYGYGGGSNSSNSRHTRDSSLDGYEKGEL